MDKKIIRVGSNSYKLLIGEFDEEVEVEDLLKIDYSNIVGEVITFPIIVNRLGVMLADMEANVSEKKLNLEIKEAQLREKYELEMIEEGKKATVDKLNTAVSLDKTYQTFKKLYIEAIKQRDYVNSVFWSAKDKSNKLDRMSMSISGDVEDYILESKVNNIEIKKSKKLID
jgi:hypothetical protein